MSMTKEEILRLINNHKGSILNSLDSLTSCLRDLVAGWQPDPDAGKTVDKLVGLMDWAETQIEEIKDTLRQWPS